MGKKELIRQDTDEFKVETVRPKQRERVQKFLRRNPAANSDSFKTCSMTRRSPSDARMPGGRRSRSREPSSSLPNTAADHTSRAPCACHNRKSVLRGKRPGLALDTQSANSRDSC